MTDLRAEILAEARSLLGVRWMHQGRSAAVGVDCPALVILPCKKLGLSDFDLRNYERLPSGNALMRLCDEQMTRIRVADMQAGDAVLLRIRTEPQHLAILGDHPLGGFSMIHGDSIVGRVVENRMDERWMGRVVAAYRLPGVPE